MKIKFFMFGFVFYIAAFWTTYAQAEEFRGERAGELIRRNIFLGETQFPVEEPLAWPYGNVHVDGPEGGMLYRFVTNREAIEWIVSQWGLDKVEIHSPDELPLDFLKERPAWWRPEKLNPKEYFISVEKFKAAGERREVLIFDTKSGLTHIVEHFSDMPGI